jgi:hypothetical protein
MSRSLFLVFAPLFSIFHYVLLGTVSALMTSRNVRPRYSIPLTILIANIVFSGVYVWFLVSSIQSGHATSCRVESDQCRWINGAITEPGIRALAQSAIEQIVINLIPLLIVWPFGIRPNGAENGPKP